MPPVVAVVAAVGAFLGSAGAIVMTVGLTVASGLVRKLLSQPPSQADFSHDAVTRQVTVRQPIAPWRIIYGHTRIGGVITFLDLSGASNEYLHMVVTLACHEVQEIGDIYLDDKKLTLDGTGNATGDFYGLVYVNKNLGDLDESTQPFPELVTQTSGHWGSDYLQRGHAKLYIRLTWNQDKFPAGIPNIKCDIKGRKVWDPRNGDDSTVREYSENPSPCLLDYTMDEEIGLKVPVSEVNLDTFVAAANFCDEDIG